jgi:Mn2+/Fe2+ NRAMP family transporter
MELVFSNLITFFIIATTAATLGQNGIRSIETAADAAAALAPLAGSAASFLFALGIIIYICCITILRTRSVSIT